MESKKTEPESNDADVKEGSAGKSAEGDAVVAIPVSEQIDDSELPQSIKDKFRQHPESDPDPE